MFDEKSGDYFRAFGNGYAPPDWRDKVAKHAHTYMEWMVATKGKNYTSEEIKSNPDLFSLYSRFKVACSGLEGLTAKDVLDALIKERRNKENRRK